MTVARYNLRLGDCMEVMAKMPDGSVEAAVCDPPYHLQSIVKRFGAPNAAAAQFGSDGAYARASSGFMGKTWDGGDIAFQPALWAEVLRVLTPGGFLLAFAATRNYHRMACAIEDAGFEIRDQIGWLFGSGMPKSHKVGDGIGTALKPAFEPICMARKAVVGTVASNVHIYGTGGLNIDKCRIPVGAADARDVGREITRNVRGADDGWGFNGSAAQSGVTVVKPEGRWPANIVHDGSDEAMSVFPSEAGAAAPVRGTEPSASTDYIYSERPRVPGAFHGDTGSAARFFYAAKASREDREEGCEQLADSVLARSNLAQSREDREEIVVASGGGFNAARVRKNNHPTVKPTELMRYLCRLVTPNNGVILDPFMGSGSTGKAAMMEGFRFIGIERDESYMEIAQARVERGVRLRGEETAQGSLFGEAA